MKIAILLTGEIRHKNQILEFIDYVKNQFDFCDTSHIYFQTWENQADNELIQQIKKKVHKLLITPSPKQLEKGYELKITMPEKSYNTFCMFTGISYLCEIINFEDYDYVCRYRNDLYIKDNFEDWLKVLSLPNVDYICPILIWMFDDGCNDHFGISKSKHFKKIWYNSAFELDLIFKYLKDTPETVILKKLKFYNLNSYFRIPEEYKLYHHIIKNNKVDIPSLNSYMHEFMKYKLSNIKNTKDFIKFT